MELSRAEALSRTTRLLNEQLLGGRGDPDQLADLLGDFTVRLVADADVVATRAGQELILAANLLVRRMGMAVRIEASDAPLIAPAPPYEGEWLHEALCSVEHELIPSTAFALNVPGQADVTFILGSSAHENSEPAFRVGVADLRATVKPAFADPDAPLDAESVIAALAAAACVASQSLRAILPGLAEAVGVEIRSHSAELDHAIEIDLEQLFPGLADLPRRNHGRVDFISAGAITNAALYTLLRLEGFGAIARVIEPEELDLSNLNRYMLALTTHLGQLKIRILERFGTRLFRIAGEPERFDDESRGRLRPLAPRVLVGVDHVRSRWTVQREHPRWLCVGATEGFDALVSIHRPGEPCAGCIHPFPNDDRDEVVPTVSFVSFFAGFLQALALLHDASGIRSAEQVIHCMAFGWEKPVLMRMPLAAQAQCPVCGGASAAAA